MKTAPRQSVARHWVDRDLPIIVENAASIADAWAEDAFLHGPPQVRFAVVAPLMSSTSSCVGSLVIMDTSPRHGFNLTQCDFLTSSAGAVAALLGEMAEAHEWWKLPIPSSDALNVEEDRHTMRRPVAWRSYPRLAAPVRGHASEEVLDIGVIGATAT